MILTTLTALVITASTQAVEPRILTSYRPLSEPELTMLRAQERPTDNALQELGYRRRTIDGVDHIFDQNLGGLLDLSYGLTTLRIFQRFKSGDVIQTKDLSRNERIALISKLNPVYYTASLDTNIEIGFVATQGALVQSGNQTLDLWDFSKKAPDRTQEQKLDNDPKANHLKNYEPFYVNTPVTSVRLKGRITHSRLFESNSKLQSLISEELGLLVKDLNELLLSSAAKFGIKLDKEGSPVNADNLSAYENYLRLSGATSSEYEVFRNGKVSKSFLGFGLNVMGDRGTTFINFAKF